MCCRGDLLKSFTKYLIYIFVLFINLISHEPPTPSKRYTMASKLASKFATVFSIQHPTAEARWCGGSVELLEIQCGAVHISFRSLLRHNYRHCRLRVGTRFPGRSKRWVCIAHPASRPTFPYTVSTSCLYHTVNFHRAKLGCAHKMERHTKCEDCRSHRFKLPLWKSKDTFTFVREIIVCVYWKLVHVSCAG